MTGVDNSVAKLIEATQLFQIAEVVDIKVKKGARPVSALGC